jgi:hypothetical protein
MCAVCCVCYAVCSQPIQSASTQLATSYKGVGGWGGVGWGWGQGAGFSLPGRVPSQLRSNPTWRRGGRRQGGGLSVFGFQFSGFRRRRREIKPPFLLISPLFSPLPSSTSLPFLVPPQPPRSSLLPLLLPQFWGGNWGPVGSSSCAPCGPMRPHTAPCGPIRPHAAPCGPMQPHDKDLTP